MTAADALVQRLVDVQAKIAELNAEAEGIKQALRDGYAPGEHEVGGVSFKITPGRRFVPEMGYAKLPKARQKECLSIVIDPAKVKRLLTPEQIDECMEGHGKAKVSIG